jgi:nucleotide-binding universal stress UspA family protein
VGSNSNTKKYGRPPPEPKGGGSLVIVILHKISLTLRFVLSLWLMMWYTLGTGKNNHPDNKEEPVMKKILLPVDVSDRNLKTIERAKADFAPDEAKITLLTVVESAMHFKYDDEYERYQQKRRRELESLSEQLEGYDVSTVILQGNPGGQILDYAAHNQFDMLIMTRSKRGGLGKLGSVASRIVNDAPNMDLLILRED